MYAFNLFTHLPLLYLLPALSLDLSLFSELFLRLGFLLVMASSAWEGIVRSFQSAKRNRLNSALHAHFSYYEIEQATQSYIPTRYETIIPKQAISVSNKKQGGNNLLIPLFIDNVFETDNHAPRFFMILGDAGSGKTSFILNLFYQYSYKKWQKQHVILLSFDNPSTIDAIANIKNRDSTILLLDALDKDPKAIQNYENRLGELYEKSQDFKKVVITCRRNFFSKSQTAPIETYLKSMINKNSQQELVYIHLSPFNDREINSYLRKKFPIWDFAKRNQAISAKLHIPQLVVQPLILSYIDQLQSAKPDFNFSHPYEIYQTLVDLWIEQELQYYPEMEKETFGKILYNFIKAVALQMYQKQQKGKGLFLKKEEMQLIAKQYKVRMESLAIDNRSLLNYNASWEYKFAHKSILEYLLAKEAFENATFFKQFPFPGLDQAKKFVQDLFVLEQMVLVPEGKLRSEHQNSDGKSRDRTVGKFYLAKFPLRVAHYQHYCEINEVEFPEAPSWGWEAESPIINISCSEAQSYCKWLSRQLGLNFRLPNELEWEHAARSGKNRRWQYAGSDEADEVAWYNKNSARKTHPVGQKKSNELGIYDMNGQVWEWCANLYKTKLDQNTSAHEKMYVIRGGSWLNHKGACQVHSRGFSPANRKSSTIGFRLALDYHLKNEGMRK